MPFPPPPPPPPRRGRGDDLDEPSAARLSLRRLRLYSPGRTAAPIQHHHTPRLITKKIPVDQEPRTTSPPAVPPPSIDVEPAGKPKLNLSYYNACQLPTLSQESSASVVHRDESRSESEFELDSPPHIIIKKIRVDQEPMTPTSPPPGSPPSIDVEPAELTTFGSDTEEWYSSDGEDDPYFKSLVDNFIASVCNSSEDNIDKKADTRRRNEEYAESALKYYNNDKNNKVKYDLIRAIVSCGMLDVDRCYGHVNFIAKGNQEHSKEELFFAELQLNTLIPTSVLSLERVEKVGGLRESKYDKYFNGEGLPIDEQHCYACRSKVIHPKNGALYESGHVAFSSFYHMDGN